MTARKIKGLPKYEQRLVLFIDFLGFTEIVSKTVDDTEELKRLLWALDRLGEIGQDAPLMTKRATQFSDSFVASYLASEPEAVFHLLNEIAFCVIDLAQRGYLVRGAVTMGSLYHSKRHVVGPAMVAAYEQESKVAKFPRVLIDPAVADIARRYRAAHHSPSEGLEYVRGFMTEDEDGLLFFDYVSFESVVVITGAEGDAYPEYLSRIGEMVANGLKHPESGVRSKYLWLHRQYVAAIALVESLSPNDPYRIAEPENYETLINLPKYEKLARLVSRPAKI